MLAKVAALLHVLNTDVTSGGYNVGLENLSLLAIAERVCAQVPAEVIVTPSNDPRSYRLDSAKIVATGFRSRHGVDDAIREMSEAVASGRLVDEDRCYNVKWMNRVLMGVHS